MELSAEDAHARAERAFGGLRRLYGDAAYERLRRMVVAVVGVGGVGSWAVEALARCGVAGLVLIDLDQVSESNINRQIQALHPTLGQSKVDALRQRIAQIHPDCRVQVVEDFVTPENWPQIIPQGASTIDAVIDACDQSSAKRAMARWALQQHKPLVCVGAAGGKRLAHAVTVDDLAYTTHDPLLAGLRQRLRKDGVAPRQGRIGLQCVYSPEAVLGDRAGVCGPAQALNCHGYGSSVMVTASFGMVAANACIAQALKTSASE